MTENEVAADCTNDGSYDTVIYCSTCGEEMSRETITVPATGHSDTDLSYNSYGDGTHDVICNVCGDISVEKATCSYVDHKCQYCEDLERMTVIFMNGNEVWTSASCGYGETLNFYGMPIPEAPKGHAWAGWYTEDGVKVEPGMTVTTNLVAYATWTKQSYTLTINVLATNEIVEIGVPYNANLLEVLAQAEADGLIPAMGTAFRVNEYNFNGEYVVSNYTFFAGEELGYESVNEYLTMPASDFELDQGYNFVGWVTFDQGVEYADNGSLLGWNYIEEDYDGVEGGAWYYFAEGTGEWEGYYFRVEGISRVPYPTEAINGITYGPNPEDLAYAQANGLAFIDADTSLFVFDEDGKFQQFTGAIRNEDNSVVLHYAINGQLPWHIGLVQVGSHVYYFVGENVKAVGDVYVTRFYNVSGAVMGGIYTFGADGNLCRYDGITEVNGVLRYYEHFRLMAGNGLTKVGDEFIYVRSNGELVVNKEYYVPANNQGIEEGIYTFDANGYLVIPKPDPVKDGIYFENGAWYYYENGVIGYNKGLVNTLKNWYDADGNAFWGGGGIIYVRSNGQLATGKYYVTNLSNYDQTIAVAVGAPLQFNEYGLMGSVKNGIVDGYYYENNQIVYSAGLIQIDGNYYYVRSNGQVVMGRDYWISNANDTGIKLGCYTFDENGVMQIPETYGFTGIKNGYYYIDGSVAYGAGVVKLDDGTYIYVRSNGQLAVGKYWPTTLNGYLPAGEYDFGEDGILTVE